MLWFSHGERFKVRPHWGFTGQDTGSGIRNIVEDGGETKPKQKDTFRKILQGSAVGVREEGNYTLVPPKKCV